MDSVRTPDENFAALDDFPFAPNYLQWNGLRIHYLDEGPATGPVVLLLHGEPTWCYLYRKMIPALVAAGYRCIAPDYVGFGKSDKITDDGWYTIARHIGFVSDFIQTLDLTGINLVVQDWGGPIGLRQAVTMPERFARLFILNTWLHHEGFDYNPDIRWWRQASQDPAQLGGDMPIGRIVAGTLRRDHHDKAKVVAAYLAPYTDMASKAGARRFPYCLPFENPGDGDAVNQARDFAALPGLPMSKHLIFGDADKIFTADWGRAWAANLGATFDAIKDGGHFVQEDGGEEIAQVMLGYLPKLA